ncbi:MAG TPA: DUF2239 family protein, partial [Sphingopyxis sp.]|nr:DUF2239 family protein [Sphingopyxis sp.]
MTHDPDTVTAFLGDTQLAAGRRETVTRTLEGGYPADLGAILVFDDRSGRLTDLDYWDAAQGTPAPAPAPSAGRPRLGVKARE